MRHSASRRVAFNGGQNLTARLGAGEMCAEFVIGMAAEPGAKVLLGLPVRQVLAQQALNGIGYKRCRAAIADRASDCSMLTHRSAEAEIEGVGQFALVLDLLALDTDVGDPMLAAAIGAAGDVQTKLLVEFR